MSRYPVDPDEQPAELLEALARLRRDRRSIIPVVGAGLAAAAGAPGAHALGTAIKQAMAHPPASDDLFDIADAAEVELSTSAVQQIVADTVSAAPVTPTGSLRSLTRLPTRVIVTTNYDDAIEISAAAVGLQPITFGWSKLNEALKSPPNGVVNVLHIHGHRDDPSSIVLTKSSYDDAVGNDAVTFGLRQLASQYNIVFLGFSLGKREAHFRRNLLWAAEAFEHTGPHTLLIPESDTVREDLAELVADDHVLVVAPYRNENRTFETVQRACHIIGLRFPSETEATLPTVDPHRRADDYLPVPVVPAEEISEPDARATRQMFGGAFGKTLTIDDVLKAARAAIVGEPGSGKTQTLLNAGAEQSRDTHVVYLPLERASAPPPGADPTLAFVRWLQNAEAFRRDTARIDVHALQRESYLFLLDGLDEVQRNQRDAVMNVIEQVADAHPQHGVVVATRPFFGYADRLRPTFEIYELVPDQSWFDRYRDQAGVTEPQLQATVPPHAPLQDMVRLPIFGAAVVEAARRGQQLSASPTEAILTVARTGFERDSPRTLADPTNLDRWLDGLAVVAEACHTNVIDKGLLHDADVARAFHLGATEELLEEIIQRSLVVTSGEAVSFPANIIQEARTAQALLQHPSGQTILEQHVLLQLDDENRGIHPSWRHTVELLAYDAPAPLRERIAEFDPRLVARATSTDADLETRRASLQTLLDWYDRHHIWFIRQGNNGQLRSDRDAIAHLARSDDELLSTAAQWATERLQSTSHTHRGNALQLLTAMRQADAVEEAVPDALQDPDVVVRRIAAESIFALHLEGYHEQIIGALDGARDELEQRALVTAFIHTAPRETLVGTLLRRWPPEMDSWSASSALRSSLGRLEQLTVLRESDRWHPQWIETILQDREDWTPEEIRTLAEMTASRQDESHRRIFDILRIARQHPVDALVGAAQADVEEPESGHLFTRLLWEATVETLEEAVSRQEMPERVNQAIIDHVERRRTSIPATASPTPEPTPDSEQTTLSQRISEGWEAVTDLHPHALESQLEDLDEAARTALYTLAAARWQERADPPSRLTGALERPDSNTVRAPDRETFPLLLLAAEQQLPLDAAAWMDLLSVALIGDRYDDWLTATVNDDVYDRLHASLPELDSRAVERAADILPRDIPAELATAIGIRLVEDSPTRHLSTPFAENLVAAGRVQVLREILTAAPDNIEVLATLVQAGDCDAEEQLLRFELSQPVPTSREILGPGHWLNDVRCRSSADLLLQRVRECEETDDADGWYVSAAHKAFQRAAGERGLRAYDELMRDAPGGSADFLWYRRAELLDQLLADARPPVASTDEKKALMNQMAPT